MSERDSFEHAGPTLLTTIRPIHVGLCQRCIDENDVLRIDVVLVSFPVPTFLSSVFAFLFGGKVSVFLVESVSQLDKLH